MGVNGSLRPRENLTVTTLDSKRHRKVPLNSHKSITFAVRERNTLSSNKYMYMETLLIGGIGLQEVLLIALVILLFFGGKKIPELMRGLGKGVRSFKEGMNGTDDDSDAANDHKDTSATDKKAVEKADDKSDKGVKDE